MPFTSLGGSSSGGSVVFAEEGSAVGTGTILNFVGAGVTATFSSGTAIATISGGTVQAGVELDYVQITSDVNCTATSAATANTIITGSAVSYDGSTTVVIEFFSPACEPAAGNHNLNLQLYDGSSDIGTIANLVGPDATNTMRMPVRVAYRLTPSNASHTYSVRGWVDSGTGVVRAAGAGAGVRVPTFIRICRVS